jgi:hypothetical protein
MKFSTIEEEAVLPPMKASATIADLHNEINMSHED